MFHVSSLKKKLGHYICPLPTLPLVDNENAIFTKLEGILVRRMKMVRNHTFIEVLIKWVETYLEDSL